MELQRFFGTGGSQQQTAFFKPDNETLQNLLPCKQATDGDVSADNETIGTHSILLQTRFNAWNEQKQNEGRCHAGYVDLVNQLRG